MSAKVPPIITATETTPTSTAQAIQVTTASDLRILSSHTSSTTTIGFSSSSKTFPINENMRGHSQITSEPAKDTSATTITDGTESTTCESSTNLPNTHGWQTTVDQISVGSARPSPRTYSTGTPTQNSYSSTDSVRQTIHMTSRGASRVSFSTTESTVSVTNISSPLTIPAGIQGSAGPSNSNNSQLGSGMLVDQYIDLLM